MAEEIVEKVRLGRPCTVPDWIYPIAKHMRDAEQLSYQKIARKLGVQYGLKNSSKTGLLDGQALRRFMADMQERENEAIAGAPDAQTKVSIHIANGMEVTTDTYRDQIAVMNGIQTRAMNLADQRHELNYVHDTDGNIIYEEGQPVVADKEQFKRNIDIHNAGLNAYRLALEASPAKMITEYLGVVLQYKNPNKKYDNDSTPSLDDVFGK